MSVAVHGLVDSQDIARGRQIIGSLLAPLGLCIAEDVSAQPCGFTYVVYFPKAHRSGEARYLYAGGSMKHPHREGARYFGSCREPGYSDHKTAAAIRFVIETTIRARELVNAAERRLLSGLDAAGDPRFWNRHNGAGAGWGREVALAAWKDPAFRAGASERARKAALKRTRRHPSTPKKKVRPQGHRTTAGKQEATSARRRAGAIKAWSNPAFRAGASERARKAAATRRQTESGSAG